MAAEVNIQEAIAPRTEAQSHSRTSVVDGKWEHRDIRNHPCSFVARVTCLVHPVAKPAASDID
jgi:hypothetical protein